MMYRFELKNAIERGVIAVISALSAGCVSIYLIQSYRNQEILTKDNKTF